MLGVGPAERVGVSVPLREGQTVLFFTDGLVERRDEDLDVGRARLLEEVRALPEEPTQPGPRRRWPRAPGTRPATTTWRSSR